MFILTPELKAQIEAHTIWCARPFNPAETVEPINPWDHIVAEMVDLVKEQTLGWSTPDEMVVDFLNQDYDAFFEHLRNRYRVSAIDSHDIIEAFRPYIVLQQYSCS